MRRFKNTELIKLVLYGVVPTIMLICFVHNLLRNTYPGLLAQRMRFDRSAHDVYKLRDLQKLEIPTDYAQRDFIADNDLVDTLLPLLKTHTRVVEEVQRIQYKMLTSLIGKFKYAMLFNFATSENKGDSAITVGELVIIRKLGIKLIFHCRVSCKKGGVEHAKNISEQYSTDELVILMHGGGNLLAYIIEDFDRKLVLEYFPNHEVILFPKSILHRASEEQLNLFQDVYSNHQHLTFLYRDRNSYNLGKKLFPRVKCYLMPDIAFQIGTISRFMEPTHDILWLHRNDKESLNYKIPADTQNYEVTVSDWRAWKTPLGTSKLEDAFIRAANGMMFLQRGRVVITDRLHGHILSVLCGIPHVVLDPVNNKITSFMQSWTAGIDNILVAYSAEDALNKAIELLRNLNDTIPKAAIFRQ